MDSARLIPPQSACCCWPCWPWWPGRPLWRQRRQRLGDGSAIQELIDLQVISSLNGETGCVLRVSPNTLGREVRKMVSQQLPAKDGGKLALYHQETSPLMLHQTLQEQGIEGTTQLSCTYVPTDLSAAWSYLQGFQVSEEEFALEGVTEIKEGWYSCGNYSQLPQSL